MTKYQCEFCTKWFTGKKNYRNRRYKTDLLMCSSCEINQFVLDLMGTHYKDHCLYCDMWTTHSLQNYAGIFNCGCGCTWFTASGRASAFRIEKAGTDMLYCHYEILTIKNQFNDDIQMMKLKFSSSDSNGQMLNFNRDGAKLKEIVDVMKQIPSSKRSFDSNTNIWVIPATQKDLIRLLLSTQQGSQVRNVMLDHINLDLFLNPPAPETKNTWSHVKVKAEKVEDFFNKPESIINTNTLAIRFLELVKPYIAMPENDTPDKEWMMRAYKITARKLHPDLGGDAKKMSELNELWSQYKELVQ